jgi:hypothetical protein
MHRDDLYPFVKGRQVAKFSAADFFEKPNEAKTKQLLSELDGIDRSLFFVDLSTYIVGTLSGATEKVEEKHLDTLYQYADGLDDRAFAQLLQILMIPSYGVRIQFMMDYFKKYTNHGKRLVGVLRHKA